MKPYDIHISYVSWGDKGKRRPVLVLSADEKEAAVFPITSQYENKSEYIQSQYIEIDDWAQAGLSKQSYIDIGKIIDLPVIAVHPTQVGRLSEKDLRKLIDALNN